MTDRQTDRRTDGAFLHAERDKKRIKTQYDKCIHRRAAKQITFRRSFTLMKTSFSCSCCSCMMRLSLTCVRCGDRRRCNYRRAHCSSNCHRHRMSAVRAAFCHFTDDLVTSDCCRCAQFVAKHDCMSTAH